MKNKLNSFISKYCTVDYMFIYLFVVLLSCLPLCFTSVNGLYDLAVQIKAGEWILDNHNLINNDVFSWHENLNWVPHEQMYYLLDGLLYKYFGLYGIYVFISIVNIIYGLIAVMYNKKLYNSSAISLFSIFIITNRLFAYPMNNARPDTLSLLFMQLSIIILLHHKNDIKKLLLICLLSWLTVAFHGGIILVFFINIVLYIAVDIISNFSKKNLLYNIVLLLLSFVASLLTPQGLSMWTYNSKQSMYPEIRSGMDEWKPMQVSIIVAIFMFILMIGFIKHTDFKKENKYLLFGFLSIFMFFIGCLIYIRLMRQLSIVMIMFAPTALDSFFTFLKDFLKLRLPVIKDKTKIILKNILFYLNYVMLILIVVINFVFSEYFIYNTINDCAIAEGYDMNVISFIKDNNYKKVFHDLNIGSWLLFNDIKVHTDCRLDPYLASISGEDHVHREALINNIYTIDRAVELYNCDAILLYFKHNISNYNMFNTTSGAIDLSDKWEIIDNTELQLLHDIELSGRYNKVYDNITFSKNIKIDENGNPFLEDDYKSEYHFVIYEPIKGGD